MNLFKRNILLNCFTATSNKIKTERLKSDIF